MERTMNRTLLDVRWLIIITLAVNITAQMEVYGVASEDLLPHFVELHALNMNIGEALDNFQLTYEALAPLI